MNGKSKWQLFEIIGKPYALNILESLFKEPKRYSDLEETCPIDKTRTKRLRELEKAKLIETITKKIGKKERSFIHYKLTKKGEKLMKQILKIEL